MAKKKLVEVVSQTKEDKILEKESKRLRELAFSRGLLSEKKAVPEVPLRPHAGKFSVDWFSGRIFMDMKIMWRNFDLAVIASFLSIFRNGDRSPGTDIFC